MKTHDHDNAHVAQRRTVAHQARPATVDHHLNHSPRLVAQRQDLIPYPPYLPRSQTTLGTGPAVAQAVQIGTIYKSTDGKNYRTKKDDNNYLGVKTAAAGTCSRGKQQRSTHQPANVAHHLSLRL